MESYQQLVPPANAFERDSIYITVIYYHLLDLEFQLLCVSQPFARAPDSRTYKHALFGLPASDPPPPHEREREWKRKRNSKVSCLSPLGMLRVEAIVILPGYPLGATGLKVPRGPDDGRLSLPIVQLKSFASAEPFFLQRVCNSKEVIKPFQLRRLFPDLRFQLI